MYNWGLASSYKKLVWEKIFHKKNARHNNVAVSYNINNVHGKNYNLCKQDCHKLYLSYVNHFNVCHEISRGYKHCFLIASAGEVVKEKHL